MKLITVHLKDNEPVRIKCDTYELNNNIWEFIKDGKILTHYNFTKDDVIKIDDPPSLAIGFRLPDKKSR